GLTRPLSWVLDACGSSTRIVSHTIGPGQPGPDRPPPGLPLAIDPLSWKSAITTRPRGASEGEEADMPRNVRGGLIQARLCEPTTSPVATIREAMIDKHLGLIARAAGQGAQVVCLQELFYGPYFCAEQRTRWYELTERVPDGPTTRLMADVAKKHK